MTSLGCLY